MMSFIRFLVIAAPLFLLSFRSLAACDYKGKEDFTVSFTVVASKDYQSFFLGQGSHGYTLWYTQNKNSSLGYIFNEQTLVPGTTYQIRIVSDYQKSIKASKLTYYINDGTGWESRGSKTQSLENGRHTPSPSDGITDIQCENSVNPPPLFQLPDLCSVFPEPVQSWASSSSLTISNPKGGQGLYPDYYITGWTDSYLRANTEQCQASGDIHNCQGGGVNGVTQKLKLPFSKVTDWSSFNSCDSAACAAGNSAGMITTPKSVDISFNSMVDATIDGDDFVGDCGNGSKCNAYLDPQDSSHIIVEVNQGLRNLTIHEPSPKRMTVKFSSDVRVEKYEVNGTVTTHLASGRYYFSQFLLNHTNLSLVLEDDVEIVLGGSNPKMQFTNAVDITQPNTKDSLYIYAPQGEIRLNASETSQEIRAMVLARSVTLDSNNYIRGAVTTNSLAMYQSTNAIIGDSDCFTPPAVDVASIQIKPFNYHLTCEGSPQNIVEVHIRGSDGDYISGYQPSLAETSGSNLLISFLSESDGIARYEVIKSDQSSVGEYPLTATLSQGSGLTLKDRDVIKYVPYKFEVDEQRVIAGQKVTLPMNVKACSDSGRLITVGYTGSPSASFSYHKPVTVADTSDLQFSANLTDTNKDATLIFKESGHIRVELEDQNFICDQDNCPVEGGALKGEFDIYSRPWKLAICDVVQASNSANTNPATTLAESGFMPAGELFSVTYKPIVHSDSKGTTTNKCEYPLTDNYSLDNGPLVLSHSVVYPASVSAAIGVLTPSSVIGFEPKHPTKTVNHVWNEVGTLQIQTTARYLEMDVDVDTQNIGRFYPAHLKMMPVAEQWIYVDGHDGFAYMSQPISHSFKVEAQNVAGEPTSNYGLFSDELIADLQYFAQSQPSGDSLFDRVLVAGKPNFGSWKEHEFRNDDTSALELSFNDFSFVKKSLKTTPLTTQPDGPFNAANAVFGLRITDDPDGIRFSNGDLDAAFPSQPEFRYGRMRLQDVGSVTKASDLNVPLKVEYWQHHRFVTNTDDNSSNFDANDYCRQVIWSESGTTTSVQFKGEGAVSSGESSKLLINQNSTNREQVRVWARIDSAPPVKLADENSIECFTDGAMPHRPWLRYNWRDIGDEDPSSVITFGIYRGNDRIIFRGEPGLFAH